jgi:hypothetical protein
MSWEVQKPNLSLNDLPDSWEGFTKEQRVQRKIDVIEECMKEVRKGTFDVSEGDRVASLVLETQLDLAPLFCDIEASARNAKHIAEYVEAEVGNAISAEVAKKPSEGVIKRQCLASDEVRDAKKKVVDYERDYKKWRCVYDILREAHIMFRNISKLA